MNLNELTKTNNKNMQSFCISKINEISNFEKMYEHQIKDKAYYCDYKELNYKLGQCKIEREYYTYFLHLLQEEYVNLKKAETANIIQLTM